MRHTSTVESGGARDLICFLESFSFSCVLGVFVFSFAVVSSSSSLSFVHSFIHSFSLFLSFVFIYIVHLQAVAERLVLHGLLDHDARVEDFVQHAPEHTLPHVWLAVHSAVGCHGEAVLVRKLRQHAHGHTQPTGAEPHCAPVVLQVNLNNNKQYKNRTEKNKKEAR